VALDLTDDDKAALIALLRATIDRDRFPLSPRIKLLRGIIEKLGIRSTGHAEPGAESEIAPWRGAGEKAAALTLGARHRPNHRGTAWWCRSSRRHLCCVELNKI
jgi:hypothetical protein